MAREILAPQTDAGASEGFAVGEQREATIIMHAASGLVASQFGDVQISHDEGTTWQDYFKDGAQVQLANDNNAVTVYGPGWFRVNKDATTNAAGIYLSTNVEL